MINALDQFKSSILSIDEAVRTLMGAFRPLGTQVSLIGPSNRLQFRVVTRAGQPLLAQQLSVDEARSRRELYQTINRVRSRIEERGIALDLWVVR
jgi:hypothetical protein